MAPTISYHSGSVTQSQVVKLAHTWCIDNFSLRIYENSAYPSPICSSQILSPDAKNKFCLILYPNGKAINSNYLSVFLEISSNEYFCAVVKCQFAIVGAKGNRLHQQEVQQKIINHNRQFDRIGIEKFLPKSVLLSKADLFVPDDKLTIVAEISYLTNEETTVVATHNPTYIGSSSEKHFLENLLASGDLSDIVLIVSGKEFRVHKNILSARSPIFRSMFEKLSQNRVEILDLKSDVFQQLLSYIYSGKIDSIEQNAEDLLVASDTYQLIELKAHCEQYLCTKVSIETAPNLLLLADKHKADKLKTSVLDLMKRQSFDTIQSMMKAKPEVLVCMFGFLAIKK